MFSDVFNLLISMHSRSVTVRRLGTSTLTQPNVLLMPSNYYRTNEAPSDTVIAGHEFLISKDGVGVLGSIRRGDRIDDPEMGTLTVTNAEPLFDFGGSIMGWRAQTG